MRHQQVTRLHWGVTALFAVAALGFAFRGAGWAAGEEEGRALYDANCAGCHDTAAIAGWAEANPDPEARRAWLDAVLQRHHAPGDEARPLIIDYMESTLEAAEATDG